MAEEPRRLSRVTHLTPTNFDALQDDYAQRQTEANEQYMLRHLLSVLDPQPGDHLLDALGILRRLHAVIGARLPHQEG